MTFAAVQAQRLGLGAGIVTRAAEDLPLESELRGVAVAGRPSGQTTTFENVYDGVHRRQQVHARAEPIDAADVPEAWREAPIVLIGPVCGEVAPGMAGLFGNSLVGISAQGWLRQIDVHKDVRRRAWTGEPFWSGADAVFVSDEDLGRRRDQLEPWTRDVALVAMTEDRRGASIHCGGRWRKIAAFPCEEVDPTGAGDVFAAAFLVRYHETTDVGEAARFGSAAAACAVEALGAQGIAGRERIEARMREHPEIVLR